MLVAQRRRRILEHVRAQGVVSMRELARLLDTSEVTVRRDLRALDAEGLLRRTHGGAVLPTMFGHEPSYREKVGQATAEKAAIAREALDLIADGDSVAIGAGTTTLALAQLLGRFEELTVVTNSLPAADALSKFPNVDVLLTGGSVRRSTHALVGPMAEASLSGLRVSKVFLSGNGLTAERGLTTPNMVVAATDRALVAAAAAAIVLADHTKVGVDTMCQTVPPAKMTRLITDEYADLSLLRPLADAGVAVTAAATDSVSTADSEGSAEK